MEFSFALFHYFNSVAAITEKLDAQQRRVAYASDVVYGPVNEIGFDVLRDQQITRRADAVQAPADVALVDEADSVLVDEALVPLVLAGSAPGEAPTGRITDIVRRLVKGDDFTVDAGRRHVFLTDTGASRVERFLGIDSLYDEDNVSTTLVQVNVALHARELLRWVAGLIDTEIDETIADYNNDGKVNARDARALLRSIAGLE